MKILLATTSSHKLREIRKYLSNDDIGVEGLEALPPCDPPVEDGESFMENSCIKSRYYSEMTDLLTVAEDSGIEVDHLDGEPGIKSARFGGENTPDAEKNEIILKLLEDVPSDERKANYTCAVSVAHRGKVVKKFERKCFGEISGTAKGKGGFGYDPIFYYPPYGKTFGQVSLEMKSRVSHRGKAMKVLREYLLSLR